MGAVEGERIIAMHQQLIQYLTPMLGQATAANLLTHYCNRMKISIDEITPGHLNDLADAMRPMLAVWLGTTGATQVAKEIAQMGKGATLR